MNPPPFQHFYEQHSGAVFRFLTAAAGATDAEDCFQETFIAALRAYPRLDHNDNPRAWILTIAARKAADAHRARARRPALVPDVPERAAPVAPEYGVWDAVRSLPARQAHALALRYALALPHKEVARVLGCSEDAARQSVHAGLKRLKEVWTP